MPLEHEAAPAKVNLFLHVIGRRADGYHLLDSLVVFADVADEVTAEPAREITLGLAGPFAASLADAGDNLVLRAARLLAAAAGVADGARLELVKHLPVASGIGGGSADAAATMRALRRLWRVPSEVGLAAVAGSLGADVPVCLGARPARMGGVGELLRPAPDLPAFGLVLVNPAVAVATPAVFARREGPFSEMATLPHAWPDAALLAGDLSRLRNDLEAPAIALCPPIAVVLAALRAVPTCLLARMSGSGATCFGLFRGAAEAIEAAIALRRPGWWSWGGGLAVPPLRNAPGLAATGART